MAIIAGLVRRARKELTQNTGTAGLRSHRRSCPTVVVGGLVGGVAFIVAVVAGIVVDVAVSVASIAVMVAAVALVVADIAVIVADVGVSVVGVPLIVAGIYWQRLHCCSRFRKCHHCSCRGCHCGSGSRHCRL